MGKTKTQRKNDNIAHYKWLKVVFGEIDKVKYRMDKMEHEITKLKKTEKYLSDELYKLQKDD